MPAKKSSKNKKKSSTGEKTKLRDLEYKQVMEEYAQVTRLLGDRKLCVNLPDGSEKLAIIPGKMRKRCWIAVDNIILVSFREFEESKVDVIYKYTQEEVEKLIQYLEIPSSFGKPSSLISSECMTGEGANEDSGFIWKNDDDDPDDEEVDIDDI